MYQIANRTKVLFFHSYFRILFENSTVPGLMFRVNCLIIFSNLFKVSFRLSPHSKKVMQMKPQLVSGSSFCLHQETLLHVLPGCKVHLNQGRFTWRHDSVLNSPTTSLKAINGSSLYADMPGFHSPSIITGDELPPDSLLKTGTNSLYVLERTVGFETNLIPYSNRKRSKFPLSYPNSKSNLHLSTLLMSPSMLKVYSATPILLFSKCATLFPSTHNIDASSSQNFPL